ncbi:MAG: hypothetical protein AAFV07_06000, partial [Bacteroidota bacterium]
MSNIFQPPGSTPLPAYLMSKDRGYLRSLLWIGGLVGLAIGFALNYFFPEIYMPRGWYLILGIGTLGIATISSYSTWTNRYLPDITFMLLVLVYISVVWL